MTVQSKLLEFPVFNEKEKKGAMISAPRPAAALDNTVVIGAHLMLKRKIQKTQQKKIKE